MLDILQDVPATKTVYISPKLCCNMATRIKLSVKHIVNGSNESLNANEIWFEQYSRLWSD
jgi:hypothetical protein